MPAKWMKITSLLLLFLMPVTTLATNVAGMIHVSGDGATLDGRPCHGAGVGFDGERLATGGNSKAIVTSRGTIVSVSSNTSVKLGAKALELMEGAVVITSDAGSSTKVENFTISTAPGARAKFLAKRVNDELQLLALEGKVDLSDGQQTEPVPAVSGVRVRLRTDPPNSPSGAARWSWLSNDDIGILIVVAGAIAAGVALGVVNSQNVPLSTP